MENVCNFYVFCVFHTYFPYSSRSFAFTKGAFLMRNHPYRGESQRLPSLGPLGLTARGWEIPGCQSVKKTRKEQQLLAIDTYSLSTQRVYTGRNCWCCMDTRMANTSSMFHLAKWKAAKDRILQQNEHAKGEEQSTGNIQWHTIILILR